VLISATDNARGCRGSRLRRRRIGVHVRQDSLWCWWWGFVWVSCISTTAAGNLAHFQGRCLMVNLPQNVRLRRGC